MDLLERAKAKLQEQKKEEPTKQIIKPEIPEFKTTKKTTKPKIKKLEIEVSSGIDFSNLANSSDFKRLIYFAITGHSFRGSNAKLEEELAKYLNK